LVEIFLTDLTDLLVVDSMQVREVAREALGLELNPLLHSRLVKHLDEYAHFKVAFWNGTAHAFLEQGSFVVSRKQPAPI
jgi:hypothetical protein